MGVEKRTTCPFQYDAIIAFDKVKMELSETSCDLEPDVSIMDDESDDMDAEEEDALFYDCLDNVPKKLAGSKCLFVRQSANDVGGKEKASSDASWRLFDAQFKEFRNGPISQKYKGKELETYPRQHRFCSVLDRRSADKEKDINNGDEVIFFEPPNDCNSFPSRAHVPMFYFETARHCVVPGYADYVESADDEKKPSQKEKHIKGPITSLCANKGGTLLFSFHVESEDEIRCYVYVNGQAFRFLPKDIRIVFPSLFDMEWDNNKKWIESKECDALIDKMSKQLRDVHFNAFLKKYRNKRNG